MPMSETIPVRWFDDIRVGDVPAIGGKTASLGELRTLLHGQVPEASR
jgi:phosphoenolpyruvate synthase/pyruvate phosphate dikinase